MIRNGGNEAAENGFSWRQNLRICRLPGTLAVLKKWSQSLRRLPSFLFIFLSHVIFLRLFMRKGRHKKVPGICYHVPRFFFCLCSKN